MPQPQVRFKSLQRFCLQPLQVTQLLLDMTSRLTAFSRLYSP